MTGKERLRKSHIKTSADEQSQQEAFEKLRDVLGEKIGTYYQVNNFSIKWFENGAVLKGDRQQGVVFTMQQLQDIKGIISARMKRKEMMKEL